MAQGFVFRGQVVYLRPKPFRPRRPAPGDKQPVPEMRLRVREKRLTMALLIVAPLEASRLDLGRIETIRRRHDPHHALIGAHVTLVFPFDTPDAATATAHLAAVAARQGAIALRLSAYLAVRDFEDRQSHVFMVPDQGRAEIEALHDALYSGPLADQFRADIAFIPHVTVAAREFHDEAEDLARQLGGVGIFARLSCLELIAVDDAEVTTLERFELRA